MELKYNFRVFRFHPFWRKMTSSQTFKILEVAKENSPYY
jgi:hypothetical protein